MTKRSNVRRPLILISPTLRQRQGRDRNSVRELNRGYRRSVRAPLIRRAVGFKTKEAPVQIARLRTRGPGRLNARPSTGPVLNPRARVFFRMMDPEPDFFSIRSPIRFLPGLAPVRVSHFVLLAAVPIIRRLPAIQQIAAMRRRPRAPFH